MKKVGMFLFILFVSLTLFAADSFKMKVRVFTSDTRSTINKLKLNGIDDIVFGKPDIFIDIIISGKDEARLSSMGLNYKILIPNLTTRWKRTEMKGRYAFGPYYTYWEMKAELDSIHNEFPNLTTAKYSIGTSRGGNEQWAMKISVNPNVNENQPSFLIVGVHHAREPISCNVTVDFAKYICEHYSTDSTINWLLHNREIYIIPVENPDGYIWNSDSSSDGMWRKNKRDNNNNGVFDESSDGVDPNRNYTYNWGYDDNGSSPDSNSETYRGPSAGSEPITQNMMSFVSSNSNINIIMNYHSYSNLFLYPWCYTSSPTPDSAKFNYVARNSIIYNGYTAGQPGNILYNTNGDAMDWGYGAAGRFTFTGEIGEAFYQPYPETIAIQEAENFPMLVFMAKASGPYVYPESIQLNTVKGEINPGQTYSILAFLRNSSVSNNATNVSLKLESNDPYVAIPNPIASYGTISPVEVKYNTDNLSLYVTNDCPIGHIIKIKFVTYFNGTEIVTHHKFAVGAPDTLYFWDFESGITGWNLDSPWALATTVSHSPSHSLTDSPDGNYSNNTNVSAILDNLDLSGVDNLNLSFYHRYDIENGYDYAHIEIKKGNDGWKDLGIFTGSQSSFTKVVYNLDDYDTSAVSIRFRLNSDSWVTADGWYLDDVLLTGCPFPSNQAPDAPVPVSPVNDSVSGTVTLKCLNTSDPENDNLTYKFVIYRDSLLTDTIFESSYIEEGNDTTSITVTSLNPNTDYYWRVFAYDGNSKGDFSPVEYFHTLSLGMEKNAYKLPDVKISYIKNGISIVCRGKGEYSISDISGRKIEKGNFTGTKNILTNKNGIFFLKVKLNGKELNKKIIIIK